MGTLPTCPCPVLVDTSTTGRGTLRLSLTTDTPVWDTLESDTLLSALPLVSSTPAMSVSAPTLGELLFLASERRRGRLRLRPRLSLTSDSDTPDSDTPDSDTPDSDTPVWDTADSDTPLSALMLVSSTPAMSVSAPTTGELPFPAKKLRCDYSWGKE